MALCERCGEEIAVANDLDGAGDIRRDRRAVMVAGGSRRLSPTHWRLFVLLYRCRGDAVHCDHAYDVPYHGVRNPPTPRVIRAHISHLQRALEGSRYHIEMRLGLGYELVIAEAAGSPPDTVRTLPG